LIDSRPCSAGGEIGTEGKHIEEANGTGSLGYSLSNVEIPYTHICRKVPR